MWICVHCIHSFIILSLLQKYYSWKKLIHMQDDINMWYVCLWTFAGMVQSLKWGTIPRRSKFISSITISKVSMETNRPTVSHLLQTLTAALCTVPLRGFMVWLFETWIPSPALYNVPLEAELLVRNCLLGDTMFSQWCWQRFSLLEYDARTGKQRVLKFNTEYGRMGTIINHCVANDVTTLWHVVTARMVASCHYAAINYMLIFRLYEQILRSAGHLVVT